MSFKKLYGYSILGILISTVVAYFLISSHYRKELRFNQELDLKQSEINIEDINSEIGKYPEFDASMFVADYNGQTVPTAGNYLTISAKYSVDNDFNPTVSLNHSLSETECSSLDEIPLNQSSIDGNFSKDYCVKIDPLFPVSARALSEGWTILEDNEFKDTMSDSKSLKFKVDGVIVYFKVGIISVCDVNQECSYAGMINASSNSDMAIKFQFKDSDYSAAMPSIN